MEAAALVSLLPDLESFLRRFDDCFVRKEQRSSLRAYVRGQLSDLRRKSIEPMALACGLPPRNLQQFLSLHGWDDALVRDRVQQVIAREHHDAGSVLILPRQEGRQDPGRAAAVVRDQGDHGQLRGHGAPGLRRRVLPRAAR